MKIRVILSFLTFGMFFIYQMSRFNINISIVEISKQESLNNSTSSWNSKPFLLGAIFYSCWITELLGPLLFAKFGCRLVMTIAFIFNGFANIAFPFAFRLHPICAIIIRVLQGLSLGSTFPVIAWISSKWIPKNERARFMSAYHGSTLGASFTNLIGGIIIAELGWSYIFYLSGILSIIWVLFWWPYAYDTPAEHPKISSEELEYLRINVQTNSNSQKTKPPTPWLDIFTSKPVWALAILFFGLLWFFVTLSMQMPTYFDTVHSLDIKTNGFLLSIPDICKLIVGIKFPMVVDKFIVSGKISVLTARKFSIAIGYIIPGFLMIILAFFGNQHVAIAATVLIISIALNGAGSSSLLANIVDLSPNHAAMIMGIIKTATNIPGIISPILVKYIVDDGEIENWRTIFLITAILLIVSSSIFLIYSSTDVQPWDNKEISNNKDENIDLMENNLSTKITIIGKSECKK